MAKQRLKRKFKIGDTITNQNQLHGKNHKVIDIKYESKKKYCSPAIMLELDNPREITNADQYWINQDLVVEAI